MTYQVLDTNGQELDSHFDLDGNEIIFHSRGGVKATGTNTEYGKGLRLLLARIYSADLKVTDAWVDSSTVQHLPIGERRILDVDQMPDDPSALFTEVSNRMKFVGRRDNSKSGGGNSTRRIRISVGGADEQELIAILGAQIIEKDFRHEDRLPSDSFDAVNEAHAYSAIERLRTGFSDHPYGESTDYDVALEDGIRLAPKAVFGFAATEALGFTVLPKHFVGGEASLCFRKLREWGYLIIPKQGVNEKLPEIDPAGLSLDDKAWSEGRPHLVKHLRRERKSGLAQLKRYTFKQEHGKLYCEKCKFVPAEKYGDEIGEACIEVHHKKLISQMLPGETTTLEDLECLCANCHRVVHRQLKVNDKSS
jgi:5-methylcytosine-specific restriction protein A